MLFCAKYANISLCDHIATDPAVDRRVMRGVAAMQGADEAYGKLSLALAAVKRQMNEAAQAQAFAAQASSTRTQLLLTLLAVPVFYSIFDDLAEMRLFRSVNRAAEWLFGGIRRRLSAAASSIFGKQ